MRRIVRRSLTVRYCRGEEKGWRDRRKTLQGGSDRAKRDKWGGRQVSRTKRVERAGFRVMYRPPLANGRVKLCLVSTGNSLHPDSRNTPGSSSCPGVHCLGYLSSFPPFLPSFFLLLSFFPCYFIFFRVGGRKWSFPNWISDDLTLKWYTAGDGLGLNYSILEFLIRPLQYFRGFSKFCLISYTHDIFLVSYKFIKVCRITEKKFNRTSVSKYLKF